MKPSVLRQVLEVLHGSDKSGFILKCTSKTSNYEFTLNPKDCTSSISVVITSKDNKINTNSLYERVDDLHLEEMTPVELIELRWTMNGSLTEKNTTNLLREAELFLKVFKVMREQSVFIIQDDKNTKICHYINSRVFYTECTESEYYVHELNLFKLYSSMRNSSIALISPLPRKYSVKDFFTEQYDIAVQKKKRFKNTRNGVVVR
ncbi:MAG: hypothetical protein ACRC5M_05460 [Anaeroplasmataceae bacterium]